MSASKSHVSLVFVQPCATRLMLQMCSPSYYGMQNKRKGYERIRRKKLKVTRPTPWLLMGSCRGTCCNWVSLEQIVTRFGLLNFLRIPLEGPGMSPSMSPSIMGDFWGEGGVLTLGVSYWTGWGLQKRQWN